MTIYSDGSYKPLINYGGYGTLMTSGPNKLQIYGGEQTDSNNRMELMATLSALMRLNRPCDVTIISDSQYVINALNGYIWKWQCNDWKTSKGQPVAHADLWRQMLALCQIHQIHGQWIKGHAGHYENCICDRLASIGAYKAAGKDLPSTKQDLNKLNNGIYPGYLDDD